MSLSRALRFVRLSLLPIPQNVAELASDKLAGDNDTQRAAWQL